MAKRSDFFIRRLHSLIGIIPIGIFLCVHLLLNSTALGGPFTYLATIEGMRDVPFIIVAELVIIALPILFHAIYGFYVVYVSKNNTLRYNYLKNWMFYLQRITAIIVTIFVLFHVLTLRIFTHDSVEVIVTFVNMLQSPLCFIFYCIGVIASIYHFSNGLFTFFITWGIIQGPRIQKIFTVITMVIFAGLSVVALATLWVIAGYPHIGAF
ncbi:MAG: succinate dehydrogenase [Bacillota bacterium]|nr:succinate dehydrogenase [Bacillota bacterium]